MQSRVMALAKVLWRVLIARKTAATDLVGCRGLRTSRHQSSKPVAAALTPRGHYKYTLPIQTRWADNDQYGHVNNTVYYSWFDTVINHFLIQRGGLSPTDSDSIGLCVASGCQYRSSLAYPEVVHAALGVASLGRSSVQYQVGIFRCLAEGEEATSQQPAAEGTFTHVFVDRDSQRPVPIASSLRAALDGICLEAAPDVVGHDSTTPQPEQSQR
eukprot:m.458789 g.458789  ORF g.458789 m.458789 type:complete len:214 (+) comp20337_c2_seq38:1316-1957(+)